MNSQSKLGKQNAKENIPGFVEQSWKFIVSDNDQKLPDDKQRAEYEKCDSVQFMQYGYIPKLHPLYHSTGKVQDSEAPGGIFWHDRVCYQLQSRKLFPRKKARFIVSRIFSIDIDWPQFISLQLRRQLQQQIGRTESFLSMPLSPNKNVQNISPRKPKSISKSKQITQAQSLQTKYTLNALQQLAQQNSSSSSFIHMLMGDPTLKELNDTIDKQAERNKKKQLLSNFPVRYQELLQYETHYWELELKYSQKVNEIEMLNFTIKEKEDMHKKEVGRLGTQLSKRDADFSKKAEDFTLQMEKRDTTVNQLNEKISALQKTISQFERSIEKLKHDCKTSEDQIAERTQQSKSISQENSIIIGSLKQDKTSLQQALRSYEQKIHSLTNQLDGRETHVISTLQEKQEEILSITKKLRNVEIKGQKLTEQYEEKLAAMHADILMLKRQYIDRVQEIQLMEQEINALKGQIQAQRHSGSNQRARFQSARNQWEMQAQFVSMLKQELSQLRIQHKKDIQNHIEINQQLSMVNKNLHETISDLQKTVHTIQLTNSTLEKQNQRVNTMFQKIQIQHEKLIQSSGSSIVPLKQIIQKLKDQNDEGIEVNRVQERKLIAVQERLVECNGDNSLLRDQVKRLRQEVIKLKERKVQSLQKSKSGVQAVMDEVQEYRQDTVTKLAAKQKQLRVLKELVVQSEDLRQQIRPKLRTHLQCQSEQCQEAKEANKSMKSTIHKMKKEMADLCQNVQAKSSRERLLFQQLLKQNRLLKGME